MTTIKTIAGVHPLRHRKHLLYIVQRYIVLSYLFRAKQQHVDPIWWQLVPFKCGALVVVGSLIQACLSRKLNSSSS